MPSAARHDRFAGTAGNLLLTLTFAGAAAFFLAHRFLVPRGVIFLVAGGVAVILGATVAYAARYGPRPAAWIAVATAFLASRWILVLGSAKAFGARDALQHIYGLPLAIVRDGHLLDSYSYSAYPAIHLVLAEAHFLAGIGLWNASAVLAPLVGLATMLLVARTTERLWPGAGLAGAMAFLVGYFAMPPGQLYQPLTFGVLMLAVLSFLAATARDLPLARGFFLAGLVLLGLSHPYSAAVAGVVLFVAIAIHGAVLGRVRFLVPTAVALGLGLAYIAYVTQDFSRFFDVLRPNDVSPIPGTTGSGSVGGTGTVGAVPLTFSETYRQVNAWNFRILMGLVLTGWVWAFFARPRKALGLQLLLGASGIMYLLARVIAYLSPPRVMMLASALGAPFLGFLLHRLPQAAAILVVAGLSALALTAPAGTYQFFPWTQEDPAVHAFDDPASNKEVVAMWFGIAGGDLARSNPISSHPVFYHDEAVLVRSFSVRDVSGTAPETHYIYREDSEDFGFAVRTTQAGNEARRTSYAPYPTDGQLDYLASIDRIGDFGATHVHRD